MHCSSPRSSVHGDSPGKNTGVDCYALLQGLPNPGIAPTFLTSPALAGGFFTTSTTWEGKLPKSVSIFSFDLPPKCLRPSRPECPTGLSHWNLLIPCLLNLFLFLCSLSPLVTLSCTPVTTHTTLCLYPVWRITKPFLNCLTNSCWLCFYHQGMSADYLCPCLGLPVFLIGMTAVKS